MSEFDDAGQSGSRVSGCMFQVVTHAIALALGSVGGILGVQMAEYYQDPETMSRPEAELSRAELIAKLDASEKAYAELLAEKMKTHNANVWLVNTGWSGGGHGVGKRMSLKYTRAILDAIHDGSLAKAPTVVDPVFGLHVPTVCANVPAEMLIAKNTWADKAAYDAKAKHLAGLFVKNFGKYADRASEKIRAAAPKV